MEKTENEMKGNIKHYPKPDYCKCNAGHTLMEIFDDKSNSYVWDCPICIAKMCGDVKDTRVRVCKNCGQFHRKFNAVNCWQCDNCEKWQEESN